MNTQHLADKLLTDLKWLNQRVSHGYTAGLGIPLAIEAGCRELARRSLIAAGKDVGVIDAVSCPLRLLAVSFGCIRAIRRQES